jgi:hypothetical protein
LNIEKILEAGPRKSCPNWPVAIATAEPESRSFGLQLIGGCDDIAAGHIILETFERARWSSDISRAIRAALHEY